MIAFANTVVLLAGLQFLGAPAPLPSAPPPSSPPASTPSSPSGRMVTAPSQPAGMVAHVPRWSVYELALTASDKDADPYVEVDLIGVFSGPDGESIVVGGFWDGGRTFRVRFTPPVEGTWTYSTVSSDAGLDGQMGSFICTAPEPGEHGFVRGGSAQQSTWTFDDGAPAWSTLQVVHVRTPMAREETTMTNAAGVGPNANDDNGAVRTIEAAFRSSDGPQAASASSRANVDVPDSMTRDRLDLLVLGDADRAVQAARKNGAIAEVELFEPSEPAAVEEAEAHRLLDYLIARYGAYPNVVWCLHGADASDSASSGGSEPAGRDRFDTRMLWKDIVAAVHMQDPYFIEGPNARVLQTVCSASPAASAPAPTSSSF